MNKRTQGNSTGKTPRNAHGEILKAYRRGHTENAALLASSVPGGRKIAERVIREFVSSSPDGQIPIPRLLGVVSEPQAEPHGDFSYPQPENLLVWE